MCGLQTIAYKHDVHLMPIESRGYEFHINLEKEQYQSTWGESLLPIFHGMFWHEINHDVLFTKKCERCDTPRSYEVLSSMACNRWALKHIHNLILV